jgi:hypothetical protein
VQGVGTSLDELAVLQVAPDRDGSTRGGATTQVGSIGPGEGGCISPEGWGNIPGTGCSATTSGLPPPLLQFLPLPLVPFYLLLADLSECMGCRSKESRGSYAECQRWGGYMPAGWRGSRLVSFASLAAAGGFIRGFHGVLGTARQL